MNENTNDLCKHENNAIAHGFEKINFSVFDSM